MKLLIQFIKRLPQFAPSHHLKIIPPRRSTSKAGAIPVVSLHSSSHSHVPLLVASSKREVG